MSRARAQGRACAQRALEPIGMLGHTPLANGRLTAEQRARPGAQYPVELVFGPRWALGQIRDTAGRVTEEFGELRKARPDDLTPWEHGGMRPLAWFVPIRAAARAVGHDLVPAADRSAP
jgi:hypothetical protein